MLIDGQNVHFLHVRSPEPDAMPLAICHDYLGSVVEFSIIGSLTDSPVGQFAWIVENFKEWTEETAELPEDTVDLDQLLTNVRSTGSRVPAPPRRTSCMRPGTRPSGARLGRRCRGGRSSRPSRSCGR
jgi:hypothetical protein